MLTSTSRTYLLSGLFNHLNSALFLFKNSISFPYLQASSESFSMKSSYSSDGIFVAPSAEFMLRIAAYLNLMVEDVFELDEH